MNSSDPRYPAVKQLSAYWLEHPQASDTLEGICRWWLGSGAFAAPAVESALNWLVERGVVVLHRAGDGRVSYRLAQEERAGPS